MQKGLSKSGCAKAYVRIVGKAETLLRQAKHVLVELHVFVLVVERHNAVVVRRKLVEQDCSLLIGT